MILLVGLSYYREPDSTIISSIILTFLVILATINNETAYCNFISYVIFTQIHS
jgi:hypothetical protein